MTIREATKLTLQEIEASYKPTSHASYRWKGRQLVDRWGDIPLEELSRQQVKEWVAKRRHEVRPQTLRHEVSFINLVYATASDRVGQDLAAPTARLKLPRVKNKRQCILPDELEPSLMRLIGTKCWSVVEFALQTGLRRLEQFALRVEDIRLWGEGTMLRGVAEILDSKTGESGQCCLNSIAARIAYEWSREGGPWLFFPRRGGDRFFVGNNFVREVFKPACVELGIPQMRWHDLRHTAATRALRAGASLEEVRLFLRHKVLGQTLRYAAYAEDHYWAAARALERNRKTA